MRSAETALIAHVPVPHRGYLELFKKYRESALFVLGEEFITQFQPLVRHLPRNNPADVCRMVRALNLTRGDPHILTKAMLPNVRSLFGRVVMPDEDVSRAVAERYLTNTEVTFDGSWRLRWDWGATQKKRRPEGEDVVSFDQFDREVMRSAFKIAERSPDWWRQVGALLVKEGEVIISAYNQHVPHEQSTYLEGDPRSNFEAGQQIELSNALHAEAGVVAEAARRGIRMEGCDLYVTTFPCPPCAYLCAHSGIKRLYYVEGYALVAGAETLQSKGVEIIRVSQ